MTSSSKQLVTGALGFVGLHLVRDLLASGLEVVGLDKRTAGVALPEQAGPFVLVGPVAGKDRFFRYEGPVGSWELVSCPLEDAPVVQQIVSRTKPAVIYHLAAQSSAGQSFQNPAATFTANVMGTINLLEAVRQLPDPALTRLLAIGSAEEYGTHPPEHQPLTEDRPTLPVSPYGVSKVTQTMLCRQYAASFGLPIMVARSFSHTGPGQDSRFALPSFARQIAAAEADAGPTEILTGDLSPVRDFLDVRDVVAAYRLLADKGEPGQIYNVCSGTPLTMAEGLEILVGASDCQISIRQDASRCRPADIPYLVGNSNKLRDRTGWQPTWDLRQTLQGLLDEARKENS